MESCLLNEQKLVWTTSHVLWIIQLDRDILKNDKQYIQGITPWGSASKLHGRLCYTSQNKERTRGKDNSIPEDSREIQFVF